MSKFKDHKVQAPHIIGSTTINHEARVKLNLNCSEYVLMDYISRTFKKQKDTTHCYERTGFTETEQVLLFKGLMQKGFIMPKPDGQFDITTKWNSAFADIEQEFDQLFWRKDGKVFFTGSKKKSLTFYIKVRKKYSKEFLIEQRNQYARMLEYEHKRGFNRAVMMCERWLNPSNEYYLADWKNAANDIAKSQGWKLSENKTKDKQLTEEERRKAYENSNE